MKSISENIKATVRPVFMLQAKAKTDWIWKIREIKQSAEYKSAKGAWAKFAVIESKGYGKTHLALSETHTYAQLLERMEKDAEHALTKIDVAVAKKLDGLAIVDIECLQCGNGKDGYIEGAWRLVLNDETKRVFSFETIYAGGYNIQCLHVRTKYNLSKPTK